MKHFFFTPRRGTKRSPSGEGLQMVTAIGATGLVPASIKDSYTGFSTDYSYGGDGILWRYGVVGGPQTYFGYSEGNTVQVSATNGFSTRYAFNRSNGVVRLNINKRSTDGRISGASGYPGRRLLSL